MSAANRAPASWATDVAVHLSAKMVPVQAETSSASKVESRRMPDLEQ